MSREGSIRGERAKSGRGPDSRKAQEPPPTTAPEPSEFVGGEYPPFLPIKV